VITLKAEGELDSPSLETCVLALKEAGIIVYPTETFYALGIDPWNELAVQKIYALKGRSEEKRLPVIAGDAEMVARFCSVDDPRFRKLTMRFWPGPLTLVLPLLGSLNSCAVRVSSHPIARQLSHAFNGLLVSTSANKSGAEPLQDPNTLPDDFRQKVDVFVDAGTCRSGVPSTIVSLMEDPPKILREGAISAEDILATL
jgi:L-threonylcarbamoyladenylate synthase